MHVGLHHLNTKKQTKQKTKKMAKRMAKKYIQTELKKIGYEWKLHKKTSKREKIIHKVLFFVALIWPILTLPQIWNIRKTQSAKGLSIYTRWAYVFVNLCWLIYGIINKEKVLIFNYFLRFVVNLAVYIGIIIYG